MSRAIRLVELRVENVGTLRGPIQLGPFAPGINVISGSNEAGKSTLVEALKIGLFERHATRNKGVMALQPHGTKLAPEVHIVLDFEGERLQILKRFLEKPMAEVRLANGSILKAQDADDYLRNKLEGRAPKKSGLSREDMGVWGLLWVTQDESAHADPGGTLDEEVRGALAEAVGRQVGKVMGGKHGERIRARVHEELKRFYTPKTDKPTGEYKDALDRKQAADTRVAEIEKALRDVEELSALLTAKRAQLEEAERQLPALKAEREDAHRQANALQQKEARLREASAKVAAAEARVAARQRDVAARAALVEEVAALEGSVARARQNLDALEGLLATRVQEAEEAKEALRRADAALGDRREALDASRQELVRAHTRSEAQRVSEGLAKAAAIALEIEEVDRARTSGGLDARSYEHIEALSGRVEALRAKLSIEGTRILARSDGRVWIGTGKGMDVPALGRVELVPAQPGLGQAVVLAKEARSALKEALYNLGVEDVPRARERRAAREEAEREAEGLRRRIKQLAPSGLDELAVRASQRAEEHKRLEGRLGAALKAQEELDRIRAELARHSIDADAMQALRAAEKQVALARESRGAMGTELLLRAISEVTVRVGDEAPPVTLSAGETIARQVTRPTNVSIGNMAEVLLTPRGEELARATARLENAERAFASALRVHAVESLEQAEVMAQARDVIARKKAAVEQRLAEAAPRGIDPLRAEVDRMQREAQAAETELVAAREALTRQAEVEVVLGANPVSAPKFARLVELEEALVAREATVATKSARLRGLSGELEKRELVVGEPTPIEETSGGPGWTVIPGESSEWVKLEEAERALDEAFQRAQVADVGAARERWATARDLVGKRERLVETLKLVAPEGLEALRGRKRALEAAAVTSGPEGESGMPVEALRQRIEALEAELSPLEATQAAAKNQAMAAEKLEHACMHEVGELRGGWRELGTQHERRAEELVASRRDAPDAALEAKLEEARRELEESRTNAERASTELAAATPELLRDEEARAQFALESHEGHLRKLRDEVSSLQALLAKAAAEGRFEDLSEAKAEQAAAAEALARVERQARAARILWDLTEEAYVEAQRIFLGPVLNEAAPYLNNLRPGTEIRMTQDLRLDKVVRRGMEEDFGQLSGGTREQLSVIVRIALARVFAKDRRPLPLILDDTMGWTDDARFLSMVRILRDAAKELQVILLTCHGTRFDRLQPDYRVDLDELRRNAAAEMT
ncbi:AAA family ATPase [Polyangium sp. 15x6]|uniref:AAA family ATPase n=1 Tax=Polyangium sp. 15x6 TaxID=3042687 RepID=UPI00249B88D2|nr:AAA family ATPase [Polyangium sp. 15x6]MDI3287301.1 AAA family ATPase [Polyangium sp. 15x6]